MATKCGMIIGGTHNQSNVSFIFMSSAIDIGVAVAKVWGGLEPIHALHRL